jgi:hypothetical protein
MEDVTKEYLRALNKIAEDPKPYPLSEEIIWADYMVALASNPEFAGTSTLEDSLNADSFLHEFKKRFRDITET